VRLEIRGDDEGIALFRGLVDYLSGRRDTG
jgi:hypothetical protein